MHALQAVELDRSHAHLAVDAGDRGVLVQGPDLDQAVVRAGHQAGGVHAGIVHAPHALAVLLKLHDLGTTTDTTRAERVKAPQRAAQGPLVCEHKLVCLRRGVVVHEARPTSRTAQSVGICCALAAATASCACAARGRVRCLQRDVDMPCSSCCHRLVHVLLVVPRRFFPAAICRGSLHKLTGQLRQRFAQTGARTRVTHMRARATQQARKAPPITNTPLRQLLVGVSVVRQNDPQGNLTQGWVRSPCAGSVCARPVLRVGDTGVHRRSPCGSNGHPKSFCPESQPSALSDPALAVKGAAGHAGLISADALEQGHLSLFASSLSKRHLWW